MIQSFAVVIDGVDLTSPDSDDADALYEAGCDDALLTSSAGVQRAVFDREAPTFEDAVASAIVAIESSIPGARVVGVEPLDGSGSGSPDADDSGGKPPTLHVIEGGGEGPPPIPEAILRLVRAAAGLKNPGRARDGGAGA